MPQSHYPNPRKLFASVLAGLWLFTAGPSVTASENGASVGRVDQGAKRRIHLGALEKGGSASLDPPYGSARAPKSRNKRHQDFRAVVADLKKRRKGPFRRIRWFCKDGAVLPPKASCRGHGGGVQHGQWSREASALRRAGYGVPNLLVEFRTGERLEKITLETVKPLLVERFLIGFDDGWIFRRARFYRGAIQMEDEAAGSFALIGRLLESDHFDNQNFLLLREAWRLLPHEFTSPLLDQIRDQSAHLAGRDPGFEPIRAKLHALPDIGDASRIRHYARTRGRKVLRKQYQALAWRVERLFDEASVRKALGKGVDEQHFGKALAAFSRQPPKLPLERFRQGSRLLMALREQFPRRSRKVRIRQLKMSLAVEQMVYAAAASLQGELPNATRVERLGWLHAAAQALYGVGLISKREQQQVAASLLSLLSTPPTISQYWRAIQDLARVMSWGDRWMHYHFGATIDRLAEIEPLARRMIPSRLRGSILGFYSRVVDSLLRDAQALVGVSPVVLGEPAGADVRALNAGAAEGVLRQPPKDGELDASSIYLLPETTADLSPVAGILTEGEGNSLSHVQLLAANLGIPNVAVRGETLERIEAVVGQRIRMRVSPGGVVRLDRAEEDHRPAVAIAPADHARIAPNLEKLDLEQREIHRLSELRDEDSGRIVGPKAARLAELKRQFPEAVAESLAIPFGRFRQFLDQPLPGSSGTLFDWMKQQYQLMSLVEGKHRRAIQRRFLRLLRQHIQTLPFPDGMERDLKRQLAAVFGKPGEYALFVRSDTNVEDLPGFTGAGLNLTVPNVRGYEALLQAIRDVWASPFTARAFAWRQGRMSHPEQVYPSVLLMKTVPVDKSGVMVTMDASTGEKDKLRIAVNRGLGGAVAGQLAEEWRIDLNTGIVTLLADATSPTYRIVEPQGGLRTVSAPADGKVLTPIELDALRALAKTALERYPQRDEQGRLVSADIEFGFEKGELRLFQIRPFLRNRKGRAFRQLVRLDVMDRERAERIVDMETAP